MKSFIIFLLTSRVLERASDGVRLLLSAWQGRENDFCVFCTEIYCSILVEHSHMHHVRVRFALSEIS